MGRTSASDWGLRTCQEWGATREEGESRRGEERGGEGGEGRGGEGREGEKGEECG